MKKLLLFVVFVSSLFAAQTLKPDFTIKADGLVSDMLENQEKLYVTTANGVMHIFDIASQKEISKVTLPKIQSFDGELIGAKIYSIDLLNKKILLTSQGTGSYRNIWVYENGSLKKTIDTSSGYMVVMAKFITDQKILFATLSNQIFLYDLQSQKIIYQNQLSYSSFSDFQLSEDRKKLASTDESGTVHIVNSANGAILQELKGLNVDKIYDIDYKNGIVLGAGQDRRLSVYKGFNKYFIQFNFLLYACELSQDASLAAVAYNTANDVALYNISTRSRLYELVENKAVVTKILFLNKNEIFVSSESKIINHYKILKERR